MLSVQQVLQHTYNCGVCDYFSSGSHLFYVKKAINHDIKIIVLIVLFIRKSHLLLNNSPRTLLYSQNQNPSIEPSPPHVTHCLSLAHHPSVRFPNYKVLKVLLNFSKFIDWLLMGMGPGRKRVSDGGDGLIKNFYR